MAEVFIRQPVLCQKLNRVLAFLGVVFMLGFAAIYAALRTRKKEGGNIRRDIESLRHTMEAFNRAIVDRDVELVEQGDALDQQVAGYQQQIEKLGSQVDELKPKPVTAPPPKRRTQVQRTIRLMKLEDPNIKIPLIFSGQKTLTLGTENTCDIHLDQLGVSGVHATLTKHGNGLLIKDCDSTNGTFINGDALDNGGEFLIPSGQEMSLRFGRSDVYIVTW